MFSRARALIFAELARQKNKLDYFREHTPSQKDIRRPPAKHRLQRRVTFSDTKMSNPQEAWKQLQRMANRAGRGGGGPSPQGLGTGLVGLIFLGGAAFVANNALFNVDGGHRAIKYTRIGGVGKEIYAEGRNSPLLIPCG